MLCALHSYMSPYGGAGSRKRTQPCVVVGCELPRLAIRGSWNASRARAHARTPAHSRAHAWRIPLACRVHASPYILHTRSVLCTAGAQYCLGHQALKYAAGPPARVDEFMFNTEHATMFKDFLVASRPECLVLLELAHSIDDFAANSNRAVLKTRAAKIFDKYLRASTAGHRYVSAPAELTAPLAAMIDSDSSISNRTFDGVRAWVAGHLQALYETEFRDSPQFAEFAHDNLGYELPPIDPARAHMLENAGISMAEVLAPAAVGGGAAAASGAGAASSA
ncbi:hypothetical protein EON67_01655 [archaeon]|nr:MAG: hypothetical protein EON67_01655 [archaeon]